MAAVGSPNVILFLFSPLLLSFEEVSDPFHVRLYHEGKERRFGSFRSKTEARDFYEKAKQEQRQSRFFPERYQHGGYEFLQETIDRYMLTIGTKKDQRGQRCFARWWGERLTGKRLSGITSELLEQIRQQLLSKGSDLHAKNPKPCSPQRVNRYMEWIRHLLNIAVRDGKLHSNPVSKLTAFSEPTTKTRLLTHS